MEKVPGYWEHMSVVWAWLNETCVDKKDLSVVLLDTANAYGSVPYQLIFFVLKRYRVCDGIIRIFESTILDSGECNAISMEITLFHSP